MKQYDLYLPLYDNHGSPVPEDKVAWCKRILLEQFGGLTHFPQENEGVWKFGGITFHDKIVVLRVLSDDPVRTRRFFAELRVELMRILEQADVLITEQEVAVVR